MSLHSLWIALAALLPTAGVAFLFYVIIKAILEGDRNERLAHSKWEASHQDSAESEEQQNNIGHRDDAT